MFSNLPNFILYISTVLPFLCAAVWLYVKITPYDELALIDQGNLAAALSLLGAAVGMALPIASVVAHSANLFKVFGWSSIALTVQLVAWMVVNTLVITNLKLRITNNDVTAGTVLGGTSVVFGILNAACLTY